jgi:hypothetical protein
MAQVESLLLSVPLKDPEGCREAALADRGTPELDAAHRSLGFTRLVAWIQHDPAYAIVLWEGDDVHGLSERTATTNDAFFARWRGLLRVFAGEKGEEALWDSSAHRVFSWTSGEDGPEASVRLFHGSSLVTEYLSTMRDFGSDPALLGVFDRIRRRQGFTRLEVWHQTLGQDEVVLWLAEGRDLEAAYAEIFEGKYDFDRRVSKLVRASLNVSDPSIGKPELIVDWRA